MPLNDVFDFVSAIDKLKGSVDLWMQRCAQIAGIGNLSPLERKALIRIGLHNTPVRFSSLCFELCVKDQYLVTYALKKLERQTIVSKAKAGKETEYILTEHGTEMLARYQALLVSSCKCVHHLSTDHVIQWRNQLLACGHGFDDATRHIGSMDS